MAWFGSVRYDFNHIQLLIDSKCCRGLPIKLTVPLWMCLPGICMRCVHTQFGLAFVSHTHTIAFNIQIRAMLRGRKIVVITSIYADWAYIYICDSLCACMTDASHNSHGHQLTCVSIAISNECLPALNWWCIMYILRTLSRLYMSQLDDPVLERFPWSMLMLIINMYAACGVQIWWVIWHWMAFH